MAPPTLRRSSTYEVAVASAFCFFMGSMYLLARRVLHAEWKRPHALLAGTMLGLTAGCRPHYGLLAILIAVCYGKYLHDGEGLAGLALLRQWMYLAGPVAVCGILLAGYNYARFANPLELGMAYQLTGARNSQHLGFRPGNLAITMYFYLLARPAWLPGFPFLRFVRRAPFGRSDWLERGYYEMTAGLLSISPLCLLGLVYPWAARWWRGSIEPKTGRLVGWLWGAGVFMLLFLSLLGFATPRYEVDFAPALLLVAVFLCLVAASKPGTPWVRHTAAASLVAGVGWGAAAGMALSINSYGDGLAIWNPAAFHKLASFFGG